MLRHSAPLPFPFSAVWLDTMITYQMKDGSSIVVGADENIIYKDGKFYRSKKDCGAFFETVAQGIFDGWH